MHAAALAELGLDGEWSYEAIEVSARGFEALVRSLPGQGFAGVNVTVPHKLAALALADEATEAAARIGAANTLSFGPGGIRADNTDAAAIVAALPSPPAGTRALVMGAGGSARAAVWALREAGAGVSVWNRTEAKARALACELGVESIVAGPGHGSGEPSVAIGDFETIVNATTVGLAEANPRPPGVQPPAQGEVASLKELPLEVDALSAHQVVVDLVYGTSETPLTRAARLAGASVVDGIEILARQGAASLRGWIGVEAPLQAMRDAARRA